MGQQARDALAAEVDQIREGLIDDANTTTSAVRSSVASPPGTDGVRRDRHLRRRRPARVNRDRRRRRRGARRRRRDRRRSARTATRSSTTSTALSDGAARRRRGRHQRGASTTLERRPRPDHHAQADVGARTTGSSRRSRPPPTTRAAADHVALRGRERRPAEGDRRPADAAGRLPGRARRHRPRDAAEPAGLPAMIAAMTTAMMARCHADTDLPVIELVQPDAGLPRASAVRAGPARRRRRAVQLTSLEDPALRLPGGAAGAVLPRLRPGGRRRRASPTSGSTPPRTCCCSWCSPPATRWPTTTANLAAPGPGQHRHPPRRPGRPRRPGPAGRRAAGRVSAGPVGRSGSVTPCWS